MVLCCPLDSFCCLCLLLTLLLGFQARMTSADSGDSSTEDFRQLYDRGMQMAEAALDEGADDLDSPTEALDLLLRAAELAPDNRTILNGIGEFHWAFNNHSQAQQQYERVIQMWPDDHEAYYGLGMSHGLRGNYKEAQAPLEKAMELNPTNSEICLAHGSAMGNLGAEGDAEHSLLMAHRLGAHEDAVDQLWKLWGQKGHLHPNETGYVIACRIEREQINASDMHVAEEADHFSRDVMLRMREYVPDQKTRNAIAKAVEHIREMEGSGAVEHERLQDCASYAELKGLLPQEGEHAHCQRAVVFYETLEAAWSMLRKTAEDNADGNHIVVGSGSSFILCLFITAILGGKGQCTAWVPSEHCEHNKRIAKALREDILDFYRIVQNEQISLKCNEGLEDELLRQDIHGAGTVWVLDVHWPKIHQTVMEEFLAKEMGVSRSAILFRPPILSQKVQASLNVNNHFEIEPECTGTVNAVCQAWRPTTSWKHSQPFHMFHLQRLPNPFIPEGDSSSTVAKRTGNDPSWLCSEEADLGANRPFYDRAALPATAKPRWCGAHPIMHVDGFLTESELRDLQPFLSSDPGSTAWEQVSGEDCYRIWKDSNTTKDVAMGPVRKLLQRMEDLVGSPWGMVSLNECVSGCNDTRNLHHDRNFFPQRFATVLVYLSSTEEGGHTIFPFLPYPGSNKQETEDQQILREKFLQAHGPGVVSAYPPRQTIMSFAERRGDPIAKKALDTMCAQADKFFAFQPKAGSALAFWHDYGDRLLWESVHSGCAVGKGTKWTIQKFAERFRP